MSEGSINAKRMAIIAVFHAYNDELQRQAAGVSNQQDLAALMAVSAAMTVEVALRSCPNPMQVLEFLTQRINSTMAGLPGAPVPDAGLASMPVAGRA